MLFKDKTHLSQQCWGTTQCNLEHKEEGMGANKVLACNSTMKTGKKTLQAAGCATVLELQV